MPHRTLLFWSLAYTWPTLFARAKHWNTRGFEGTMVQCSLCTNNHRLGWSNQHVTRGFWCSNHHHYTGYDDQTAPLLYRLYSCSNNCHYTGYMVLEHQTWLHRLWCSNHHCYTGEDDQTSMIHGFWCLNHAIINTQVRMIKPHHG